MNTENRDDSSGMSELQINEIVYQVLLQSRERIYNRAKEILADNHALREENEDLGQALVRSEYRIHDMAEDIERLRALVTSLEERNEELEQRCKDECIAERDNLRSEMRQIRGAINANPEESTLGEVRAMVHRYAVALDELARLVAQSYVPPKA